MTGKCDGNLVLNTLIQNIASDSQQVHIVHIVYSGTHGRISSGYVFFFSFQLSSMTLELFHLLLDLNCEDVMLELILKYTATDICM